MDTKFTVYGTSWLAKNNLFTASLKLMLLKDSYSFSQLHRYVDDIVAHECDATGYTGGFNGASRKAATISESIITTTSAEQVEAILSDVEWATLGGASNNDLIAAALIEEQTTDADSLVVAILGAAAAVSTNGQDFHLDALTTGTLILNPR